MKASIPILAGLWISLVFLPACAINRADSLRMLDRRAEYDDQEAIGKLPDSRLQEGGLDGFTSGPIPVRTRPKVASIWIHPHEMASHDYFWGGWMSVVVESDQWVLSSPGKMPIASGITDVTQTKLPPPTARIPGERPKLKAR